MGFFQTIADWVEQANQNKIAKMRDQGLCPDCRGTGINSYMLNDYVYMNAEHYNCPGCDGSGSYDSWIQARQEEI